MICRSATHRVAPFSRFSFLLFLFISRPIRSAIFSGSGYLRRVDARTTSSARSREMRWPTEIKFGRSPPGGVHAGDAFELSARVQFDDAVAELPLLVSERGEKADGLQHVKDASR